MEMEAEKAGRDRGVSLEVAEDYLLHDELGSGAGFPVEI